MKDEEDVYGEEARGEDDADDDDDEGQEAEMEATLRANVPSHLLFVVPLQFSLVTEELLLHCVNSVFAQFVLLLYRFLRIFLR